MKIAFVLPGTEGREKSLNGNSIRIGGASCSGTDQSVIFVAEYLAKAGHDVVISLDKIEENEISSYSNNVQYTNRLFEKIEDKNFDILIVCLWMGDYKNLPIKVSKSLIYWYHLAWGYGMPEILDYANQNNLKFGMVYPSEWCGSHINSDWDYFSNNINLSSFKKVIPNPIETDLAKKILEKNNQRDSKSSIFHAQMNRGAHLAKRAIKELNWPEIKLMDYIDHAISKDKISLFEELSKSEYFIFPLMTEDWTVYKDTFSCSVAEAIAMGVIVVTYPLGALPEVFKDKCIYLDFPNGSNLEALHNERLTREASYLNNTENIKNKLIELENNPEIKEKIRREGFDYIHENFSINKVGKMWSDFINKVSEQEEKAPITKINNFIDEASSTKTYFINLENRKDRLDQINEQLNKIDLEAERFNAVNLSQEECDKIGGIRWSGEAEWRNKLIRGQFSCTSSHLEVIKIAKQKNLDKVLILEDDCLFEESFNIKELINNVFNEIKIHNIQWDMLFLGSNLIAPTSKTDSQFLVKMQAAYCAHAYYVNKSFYDKILEFDFNKHYTIDVYYNELMPQNNIFCIKPLLAIQQSSFSDIEGYKVSYEEIIKTNYKNNIS
jgi:glycosyl transferase family 25